MRDALRALPAVRRAGDAGPALRAVVAAERAALDTVGGDDPLAGRLRGAIAAAQRALSSVAADPLRSRSMSPTATVVPAANRSIAAARTLADELCAPS
jgi:hypothetical protein